MFFFSHTHTHALAPRWPKGKMEVGESDAECAIREVYEEIGFNITRRLRASNAISLAIRQHDANGIKTANTLTLFIIPGVSEKTPFRARTLGEISAIEWFPLSQLPAGAAVTGSVGGEKGGKRLWLVGPVMGPLREWVAKVKLSRHRRKKLLQQQQQQHQQQQPSLPTTATHPGG
jgi:mRNA-decapping enzyme subunit 2